MDCKLRQLIYYQEEEKIGPWSTIFLQKSRRPSATVNIDINTSMGMMNTLVYPVF